MMNNAVMLKHHTVDPMHCYFCGGVTMFRFYDTSFKHLYVLECTGSWDRSVPGCGFKFVYDCNPKLSTSDRNHRNVLYYEWAKRVRAANGKPINIDTETLIPITIDGDSMYPTLNDGQHYIMQITDEVEDDQIYSVVLYGTTPSCCRVSVHENGYWLSKDNKLFYLGTDLWVSEQECQIIGKIIGYEE